VWDTERYGAFDPAKAQCASPEPIKILYYGNYYGTPWKRVGTQFFRKRGSFKTTRVRCDIPCAVSNAEDELPLEKADALGGWWRSVFFFLDSSADFLNSRIFYCFILCLSCEFLTDKRLPQKKNRAVLYGPDIASVSDLPTARRPANQLWMLEAMETAANYPILGRSELTSHFNLSSTLRLNSDWPCIWLWLADDGQHGAGRYAFDNLRYKTQRAREMRGDTAETRTAWQSRQPTRATARFVSHPHRTSEGLQNTYDMDHFLVPHPQITSKLNPLQVGDRTLGILCMYSNCDTPSNRNAFIESLMAELPNMVQCLGKCLKNAEWPPGTAPKAAYSDGYRRAKHLAQLKVSAHW
jgi:hypothetical protein